MQTLPLIISFFTKNTPYQVEIQNLIHSCNELKIDLDVEGIENTGSWELNCAFKPIFILKKFLEHRRPLLWVDADAVFVAKPSFLEVFHADIAVRINDNCPQDHPSKVNSGTIFINTTDRAKQVIELWARRSLEILNDKERKEEFWDQCSLRDVIFSSQHQAQVSCLPVSYIKIFDHPLDIEECSDPVIVHYQASRRFKKWFNYKE